MKRRKPWKHLRKNMFITTTRVLKEYKYVS
jgi:hypothetical protein